MTEARLVNIRIHYTLAPQWNAQEWIEEQLDLSNAIGLSRKVLEGSVSQEVWDTVSKDIAWTKLGNGVYQVRTDAVPVKTMLDGKIILRYCGQETIEVDFDFQENRKTWYAQAAYQNVESLLLDLHSQTQNDLANPLVQQYLSSQLSSWFSKLWVERKAGNLEQLVNEYALGLGKLLGPHHAQMRQISWIFQDAEQQESYGTAFEWRSSQPLHWEVLRCLYYVVQGYFLMDDSLFVPWTEALPALPDAVDVTFLRTRMLSVQQRLHQLGYSKNKYHPGDVVNVNAWVTQFKEYAQSHYAELLTEDTLRLVWNVAVIVDYGQRLLSIDGLSWSLPVVHEILREKKYRETILRGFEAVNLGHNTYLDEAIQFWEHGAFVSLGGSDGKIAKDVLLVCKAYFTWLEAKEKGFSSESMQGYSLEQATEVWKRVRNTEVGKKFEPYYRVLGSRTPDRFFVEAPKSDTLDALDKRFPNFHAVTTLLQKYFRLLHLQDVATLELPSLLLVGSPGLGKTRYLHAIASLLGAPIHEIAMSSMSAGFVLSGSDLTWHGAKPGKIADVFLYDVCANPIFVLDELDKVSDDPRHDPYGPLHQLLEKHTAKRFKDEALQLEFNTSACSWFATANRKDHIPEAILSRFQVIEIPELTREQTPVVAQSIYDDIRAEYKWGASFEPFIAQDCYACLYGMDARAMRFALFNACANAASRSSRPLLLQASDFESGAVSRQMGFL